MKRSQAFEDWEQRHGQHHLSRGSGRRDNGGADIPRAALNARKGAAERSVLHHDATIGDRGIDLRHVFPAVAIIGASMILAASQLQCRAVTELELSTLTAIEF